MSDTPASAGTVQRTSADPASGGAGPTGESPEQKLAAAMAENQKLRERHENAQQLLTRQGQELGTLRKRVQAVDVASGYQDDSGSISGIPADALVQRLAEQDRQNGLIMYRQETPDWATFASDVDKIINDPVRVYDVVAWKSDGFGGVTVDWHKTYRAAKERVELDAFRASKAAAAQTQVQLDEQRDTVRSMATISGTSGRMEDRELTLADIKGKSAKQIAELARSLGMVNEQDPPHSLR